MRSLLSRRRWRDLSPLMLSVLPPVSSSRECDPVELFAEEVEIVARSPAMLVTRGHGPGGAPWQRDRI